VAIFGTNASEYIPGTGVSDTIWGYGGDDTIDALGGNDLIIGGNGADDINGHAGSDTSSYQDSTAAVFVSLVTGTGSGGYAQGDTLENIENLYGSAHNDTLIGDDAANILSGLSGNDTLKGGGGADTLYGDSGTDYLVGGAGADQLNGGSGTDTASYYDSGAGVNVWLGGDTASGGDAQGDELNQIENLTGSVHADNLWGSDGVNVLNGNDGADTLKGWGGNDTLNGGDGADSLLGMDGFDTLNGGNGSDTLDGGDGADTMAGGLGNDNYHVDDALDTVTELSFEGNDTVYSTAYSYQLAAGSWVETLSLDTDSDTGVYGTGNGASNTIFGNINDNVLNGGGGGDSLSGLGGNDTFVFQAGQAHGDVVYEFNGNGAGVGDVLQFSGYGTLAEGVTFHQLTATEWQITSANGLIQETITLAAGAVIDTTTDLVFV
jgi:Ca2+-binding RTX toxin-like protein